MNDVSVVLEELGDDADQVQPLFITVDPERDTPEVMAEYVANFDAQIVGLTGSPEQIKQAAQSFRAYYAKVEQEGQPGGYTMDHSAFLYLMNPEGGYATYFSPRDEPAAIAKPNSCVRRGGEDGVNVAPDRDIGVRPARESRRGCKMPKHAADRTLTVRQGRTPPWGRRGH